MSGVTVVNFSHPLTAPQLADIAARLGQPVAGVIALPAQFDRANPLDPQCRALIEATGLTAEAWQTQPIVTNLPALSIAAAVILAQLHGLMGHFPAVLEIRPVEGSIPLAFELADVLDLNASRLRGANPQQPKRHISGTGFESQ